MPCLDDNLATEFAAGLLTAAEAHEVDRHLAACADCRQLVAALAEPSAADSDVDTHPTRAADVAQAPTVAAPVLPLPRRNVGDRIDRYLVLGTLGAGGMGVVFTAYDPQLDRKVALKLLRAAFGTTANTAEARVRLRREAQAIARLSHPNVVGVYDVGSTHEGDVYIAMEFVEGENLTAWLRSQKRSVAEILEVFVQAGRGLAAAHDSGLLHRDFKPDNVLVGEHGRVRVGDFGLARSVLVPDEAVGVGAVSLPLHTALTVTGTVLGTPRYMAPEQHLSAHIDARSDQFAFCVALYEALFNAHPIVGNTAVAMLDSGARARLPPEPRAAPRLVAALMRGLDPVPSRRFSSMHVLLRELMPEPARRARSWWLAASALTVSAGLLGAVFWFAQRRAQATAVNAKLLRNIDDLERERATLFAELRRSVARADASAAQITELRQQIAMRDAQIAQLIERVAPTPRPVALRGGVGPDRAPAPVWAGTRGATATATDLTIGRERQPMVSAGRVASAPGQGSRGRSVDVAIEATRRSVTGCFREWAERYPGVAARLTVTAAVAPDGVVHTVSTAGERGAEAGSLPLCVADAFRAQRLPATVEPLELVIQVGWDGAVTSMQPVVARVRQTPGAIDVEGATPR